MLAKAAAIAGGVFIAVTAMANRPPMSHPLTVLAALCVLGLCYMAYRAGKHDQPSEVSARAEATAKSKAAAHAAGGRAQSAVQVNIGGDQLAAAVAAAVDARLDKLMAGVGVGAPTPAISGEPVALEQRASHVEYLDRSEISSAGATDEHLHVVTDRELELGP
jgi:hypothetical protein